MQIRHKLLFLQHSFSSGKSFLLGPRILDKSCCWDFAEEDDSVDDLEGFLDVEVAFDVLDDIAGVVPKDLELEEPDGFKAAIMNFSLSLHSQWCKLSSWACSQSLARVGGQPL